MSVSYIYHLLNVNKALPSLLSFPCARYSVLDTPCAWDPRSQQSILDVPMYFVLLQRLRSG